MPTLGLTQPQNAVQIVRGSSKTFELTVLDVDGAAVNLTGARVLMSVKRAVTDARPVIQKDSAVGIAQVAITVPLAGRAEIYLEPSDTQTLDDREYVFDVWVVLASGKRYPVIAPSVLVVAPSVTVIS